MTVTQLPSSVDTERALLGACLIWDQAIDDAAGIITAEDFDTAIHQHIWNAITTLHGHTRVDVIAVADFLRGVEHELCTTTGLMTLMDPTPSVSSARQYAHTIADLAGKRRLVYASAEISTIAMGGTPAADAIDQARALLDRIDLPSIIGAPDPDIDQLIAETDTSYDWLIAGWLERRDRVLVTATEGAGKSTWLAQLATQAAAGIHPWTQRRIPPCNVLVVDCENPKRLVLRRFARLREIAGPDLDPRRLRVISKPEGINITLRADRNWLLDRCLANAADLLVIGPVYKLSSGVPQRGDIGGEEQARQVATALDELRQRTNVALIMETHAPHGDRGGRDLRPFGSSLWLRWPEFGIGLRALTDERVMFRVEHWRGPRDVRPWPIEMRRGAIPGYRWPWVPTMPDHDQADPFQGSF